MRLISIATAMATASLALSPLSAQLSANAPEAAPPPASSADSSIPVVQGGALNGYSSATTTVGPNGGVNITLQNAPVVQPAAPAAGNYPPCTATLKDSCTNNPRREASTPS